MPSRRRPVQVSAAALPASRLPLGTPHIASSNALETKPSTGRSSPVRFRDLTSQSAKAPNFDSMPPLHPGPEGSTMSIADAKLQRQRQRNAEMDPTLPTSSMAERHRRLSTRTASKPRDISQNSRAPTPDNAGAVVSAVRINTFRRFSREPSLARSTSVRSHQTSEDQSDAERLDSHGDGGFQLYKPRRARRSANESGSYSEDKLAERQVSVEASYDTRQVYEVFGNALPAQEFLEQNVGHKDGHVQFLQHPNGDISAHQWSDKRYQWENIGQFSNIRKKIEGQLASDRLAGETALQTVLQNTLAYFKTIAKQREASVMGQPFGLKDIQALLPERRTEPTAAPAMPKTQVNEVTAPVNRPSATDSSAVPFGDRGRDVRAASDPHNDQHRYESQSKPQTARDVLQSSYMEGPSQHSSRYDDPFFSNTGVANPTYNTPPGRMITSSMPASMRLANSSQMSVTSEYSFHAQPSGYTHRSTHGPVLPSQVASRSSLPSRTHHLQHTQTAHQAQVYDTSPCPPQLSHQHSYTGSPYARSHHSYSDLNALRAKHDTPFNGNHTDRLDQLVRISDAAKERSLSQANIRTVLYDPLQNAQNDEQSPVRQGGERLSQAADRQYSVTSNSMRREKPADSPPRLLVETADGFPCLITHFAKKASPPENALPDTLKHSSPDTSWSKRPYEHKVSMGMSSDTVNVPRNPYFGSKSDIPGLLPMVPPIDLTAKNTDRKALQDWWTSGNRLARQDDLFQRIKAAAKPALSTPPGITRPAGLLPEPAWDETITRLLIPVQENLASYVQGPESKRRDYFTPWSQPPEWAIDRDIDGYKSFYDEAWGRPPARVGRDPRYRPMPAVPTVSTAAAGRRSNPNWASDAAQFRASPLPVTAVDRRFGFTRRY